VAHAFEAFSLGAAAILTNACVLPLYPGLIAFLAGGAGERRRLSGWLGLIFMRIRVRTMWVELFCSQLRSFSLSLFNPFGSTHGHDLCVDHSNAKTRLDTASLEAVRDLCARAATHPQIFVISTCGDLAHRLDRCIIEFREGLLDLRDQMLVDHLVG